MRFDHAYKRQDRKQAEGVVSGLNTKALKCLKTRFRITTHVDLTMIFYFPLPDIEALIFHTANPNPWFELAPTHRLVYFYTQSRCIL